MGYMSLLIFTMINTQLSFFFFKSLFEYSRFATRERNALLLYNGRFNEKHDFIAVEIIEEQVQLTFSAGGFLIGH